MTLAGVLPAGQYAVVTHVGPFGQLVEAVRNLLNRAAERGLAWDKRRAFLGLISEAVGWVTIVDSTMVRHHLEAYDGALGNRAPEERQLAEGTLAGAALCHRPAAHCLLTCGSSQTGSVRPGQKEMLRIRHQRDKNFPYVVRA